MGEESAPRQQKRVSRGELGRSKVFTFVEMNGLSYFWKLNVFYGSVSALIQIGIILSQQFNVFDIFTPLISILLFDSLSISIFGSP